MKTIALPKLEIPSSLLVGVGLGLAAIAAVAVLVKQAGGAGEAGAIAGKAAGDAAAGVVVGLGESIGIPRTNQSACDLALAEGRTWDASFACPALRFLREGIFGSSEPNRSSSVSPQPMYGAGVYL